METFLSSLSLLFLLVEREPMWDGNGTEEGNSREKGRLSENQCGMET